MMAFINEIFRYSSGSDWRVEWEAHIAEEVAKYNRIGRIGTIIMISIAIALFIWLTYVNFSNLKLARQYGNFRKPEADVRLAELAIVAKYNNGEVLCLATEEISPYFTEGENGERIYEPSKTGYYDADRKLWFDVMEMSEEQFRERHKKLCKSDPLVYIERADMAGERIMQRCWKE